MSNSSSHTQGNKSTLKRSAPSSTSSSHIDSSDSATASQVVGSDEKRQKLIQSSIPSFHSTTPNQSTHNMSQSADNIAMISSTSSASGSIVRRRAHSPPAKKKMVIKPFKVKPQLAASFEEDISHRLTNAVQAVYQKQASETSQEELYRAVEALCIHNKAALLYEKLVAQCEAHVSELMESLAAQLAVNSSNGDSNAMSDVSSSAPSPIPTSTATSSASSLSLPFLQAVQTVWNAHCEEMLIIRGIFLYLDRTYVIQMAANNNNNHHGSSDDNSPALPKSLWEMGLQLFCQQLKKRPAVEEKIISGLLGLIERDRNGENINRALLKSLLRMLSSLRLYVSSFQVRFLQATGAYYEKESGRSVESCTSIEFIHEIQSRLQQEEQRAQSYLDDVTRVPLIQLMQQQLIRNHMKYLLETCLQYLLVHQRSSELSILYQLFDKIGALDEMKESFGKYVQDTASSLVQSACTEQPEVAAKTDADGDSKDAAAAPTPIPAASGPTSNPANLIIDLLKLKVSLDQLMSFSFASNADFLYALKAGFEHAINVVENTPAELIAKFIDRVLRTGGKGIKLTSNPTDNVDNAASANNPAMFGSSSTSAPSSTSASAASVASSMNMSGGEEVESLLDQVMFLFRYIHGKDVFQAFYKKDLAKRLLLHKSASIDSEKSMISKIKIECGASFTTKLEGMFKDMELSKDIQTEYEQHVANNHKQQSATDAGAAAALPMELSVQVLTTGSWPAYTALDCTLPKEVARAHEDFKLFYLNKHSGRKLIWHHSLATAILRAHFPKARKELAVSGVQAIVLMLFNDHQKLTLEEIGKYSGITDTMELKRTLASLTFSDDVRLLTKEPRNKKLTPTDVFSVNMEFNYKLFRIKVNTVQLKETKEEQKNTTARVFEDRQYALDACIVRIMKARKTLSHQLLIMEVCNQVKFPTKPADIKKRIASLIEREYMERDKDDSSNYNYMA